MKKLLILLIGLSLMMVTPLMAETQGEATKTGSTVFTESTSVSNAAAPVLAITLVIVLTAVYAMRKSIQRRIRSLRLNVTSSPVAASPLTILELIQRLLEIIFPAIIGGLLALHLSGVIPYISTAEEIAGIVLSAGISICEVLDGFLKTKESIKSD